MRISAQNSQFIFNFPEDFIEQYLVDQFDKLMEKNFISYDSVTDYINSTIKEIVFPASSFEVKTQTLKRGKQFSYKDSKSVFDNFTNELDITFRSVDSYLNYFIMLQILIEFYLNTDKHHIPVFNLQILDKDGNLIYTIYFEQILLKTIGEVRLGYNSQDITEKTFSITFRYNFIDIRWELDDDTKTSTSIFDIPAGNLSKPNKDFKPGKLDNLL